MIKDFVILNCIGKNDKIGLRVNGSFYIHELNYKINKNDLLVSSILNLVNKHNKSRQWILIIVNIGPGSFSSMGLPYLLPKE